MEMKEKRKRRFNFVDAIIIIVALVLIAALVFIFAFDGMSAISAIFGKGETVTIYYAVEFSRVKDDVWDNVELKEGDEVIDSVRNYTIGKVVDQQVIKSEVITGDDDGNAVICEYPGYKTVILFIAAEAQKGNYGYVIDGYELQVGKMVDASAPEFTGSGYCVALMEVTTPEEKGEFEVYVRSIYEEREMLTVSAIPLGGAAEDTTEETKGENE